VRKSRLEGFAPGSTMPWSYEEFAQRYGRDQLEAAAKALELATPEQVSELRGLMDTVRMPDGWLTKCLEKANVEAIEELAAEQIAKMIGLARERLTLNTDRKDA
jgi:hypothetical protein